MDLIAVVLFLMMYYVRPQEWGGLLSQIQPVKITMAIALFGLFFRERSLRRSDLLRTPHDWMVLFLLLWIVCTSRTPFDSLSALYPLIIFYVVIVQALTSRRRILIFLSWWTGLIVFVGALALASEVGFDPLGSYDITHTRMKDRLIVNLSVFANPNALGHNLAPSIAMLYFFCIWKRPWALKIVGLAAIALQCTAIYLTLSKGAFLAAACTIVATFTFGRPKWFAIVVIACAYLFGQAILHTLPRMEELNKSKSDPAIQGRIAAFTFGLKSLEDRPTGLGLGRFIPAFTAAEGYNKSPHSSFVQVGAELGFIGLGLYVGLIYCCFKGLLSSRSEDSDDERIRRTLFVLVLSYCVSSWMVDMAYRPTYFMFAAACAAFYRQIVGINTREGEAVEEEPETTEPLPWRPYPAPQLAGGAAMALPPPASSPVLPAPAPANFRAPREVHRHRWEVAPPEPVAVDPPAQRWRKLDWKDWLFIILLTHAWVWFWKELIQRF